MRLYIHLGIAVAAWAIALVLTIVASLKPGLVEVAHMWQLLAVGVASTATLSLVIAKAQYEAVSDLHDVATRARLKGLD